MRADSIAASTIDRGGGFPNTYVVERRLIISSSFLVGAAITLSFVPKPFDKEATNISLG